MRETYPRVGSDPLASNGGDRRSWELPAQAAYVIAPDGKVLFARVDGDYRRRTEPADIIEALRQPGGRRRPASGRRARMGPMWVPVDHA
ncbi:hypothetical protein ACWFR1_05560 [Streptomyces sp. NPDC055103]